MDRQVLVVDDDSLLRRIVGLNLTKRGLSVREASTCESAVHALSNAAPDVLILDLNLPDGDGRDVLDVMRRRGITVPTVVMTAELLRPKLLSELRVQGLLAKPFVIEALLQRIREVLPAGPDPAILSRWLGELRSACATFERVSSRELRSMILLLPPPLAQDSDARPLRLAEAIAEEYGLAVGIEVWRDLVRIHLTRRNQPECQPDGA